MHASQEPNSQPHSQKETEQPAAEEVVVDYVAQRKAAMYEKIAELSGPSEAQIEIGTKLTAVLTEGNRTAGCRRGRCRLRCPTQGSDVREDRRAERTERSPDRDRNQTHSRAHRRKQNSRLPKRSL